MTYISTKTYGHEVGLSCCFRQWRADSHCKLLHGYALSVTLTFEAEELDHRNWVIDFGGLKEVKADLQNKFDHTVVIDVLDPKLDTFRGLEDSGLLKLTVLEEGVGCELFAKHIHRTVSDWLLAKGHAPRVLLRSVEVREHGANSALYEVKHAH